MKNPSSQAIYEKANDKIEKLTEFIYFASVNASPLFLVPYFFMSYFLYSTSDLEKEAFSLPFPLW